MSYAKVFEGIDWGSGSDRGYFVVSIGPDPTPETVQAFRDAYDLGCAWAEAEAALRETVHQVRFLAVRQDVNGDGVLAWAYWRYVEDDGLYAEGPTPAAALRALAAKLRERDPDGREDPEFGHLVDSDVRPGFGGPAMTEAARRIDEAMG